MLLNRVQVQLGQFLLHVALALVPSHFGRRTLKELARSYLTITRDLTRVMARIKAIYRSWGIPCAGQQVYAPSHRAKWLGKLSEAGVHRRAEFYYQQFDALAPLRQEARRDLLARLCSPQFKECPDFEILNRDVKS